MRLDTVLTVAAVALAAYALYMIARQAPGAARQYYAGNGSVPGGLMVPAGDGTWVDVPLGYDSAGGPAYG